MGGDWSDDWSDDRTQGIERLEQALVEHRHGQGVRRIERLVAGYAPATRRAYRAAWTAWEAHCAGVGAPPLPARAETVAQWIDARAAAGTAPATWRVGLAAITAAHRMA